MPGPGQNMSRAGEAPVEFEELGVTPCGKSTTERDEVDNGPEPTVVIPKALGPHQRF